MHYLISSGELDSMCHWRDFKRVHVLWKAFSESTEIEPSQEFSKSRFGFSKISVVPEARLPSGRNSRLLWVYFPWVDIKIKRPFVSLVDRFKL